jgi:hypothetical protein
MTAGDAVNLETLLRRALAPVDPPAALSRRVESTLLSITELAADELETWELAAMRDPRNWVRPAAAVVAGTAAGAALVVIRTRRRHRAARPASLAELREIAGQAAADLAGEARRLAGSG